MMIKTTQALREHTASPDKYPQGYFKDKACRLCGKQFKPNAPSHLYCTSVCASEAQQDNYYRRVYGMSRTEWEKLYSDQNGRCYICLSEGFTMAEHHQAALVVDHCHKSGTVRGLLCHNCNRALGLLHDDIEIIRRAIEYLEGATTRA